MLSGFTVQIDGRFCRFLPSLLTAFYWHPVVGLSTDVGLFTWHFPWWLPMYRNHYGASNDNCWILEFPPTRSSHLFCRHPSPFHLFTRFTFQVF
jgi:hypothetical protein